MISRAGWSSVPIIKLSSFSISNEIFADAKNIFYLSSGHSTGMRAVAWYLFLSYVYGITIIKLRFLLNPTIIGLYVTRSAVERHRKVLEVNKRKFAEKGNSSFFIFNLLYSKHLFINSGQSGRMCVSHSALSCSRNR